LSSVLAIRLGLVFGVVINVPWNIGFLAFDFLRLEIDLLDALSISGE
jgi:hypothetical protein